MEKQTVKRREWVKNAIIIFLVIMLVLTFFSNTIMNRSLPEVAAQYVQPGSINAKIRGSGTISANETYDVTLSQTRKVRSVMVRVGDMVNVGDVLLTLEPMDSEELKQAEETLADMELNYQKSLIEASNGSASENHEVRRLQEKYDEALATYRLYSTVDPSVLLLQLEKAEMELQRLEQEKTSISSDLASAQENKEYLDAKAQVTKYQSEYDTALAEYEEYFHQQSEIEQLRSDIAYKESLLTNKEQLYKDYNTFLDIVSKDDSIELCAVNIDYFMQRIPDGSFENDKRLYAVRLQEAYNLIAPIVALQKQVPDTVKQYELQQNMDYALAQMTQAQSNLALAQNTISSHENLIEGIKSNLDVITRQINEQTAVVANLTKASAAAETLKAAEQALEDKLFEVELGDAATLDMQHAKDAIEIQKQLIEALSSEADGQEIKANVAGVVSTIHTTAGNTAGADTPVISITVADRGYTIQIPVTIEQARQVSIGDTAEVTNYWNGNINATLENIINDPKNPSTGRILMFRLNGDSVEAGTNLTLSIGQRSANYDALIPNSAVRSDSNGTFVLVVTAKSSPLGNRYVAVRADIQVLASDDTTSAVSGLANGDYVITTASAPIEAGNQVRLVDNG